MAVVSRRVTDGTFRHQARLLRQARVSRGITLEQLAEELALSKQAISKWESGLGPIPAERARVLIIMDLFTRRAYVTAVLKDYRAALLAELED